MYQLCIDYGCTQYVTITLVKCELNSGCAAASVTNHAAYCRIHECQLSCLLTSYNCKEQLTVKNRTHSLIWSALCWPTS